MTSISRMLCAVLALAVSIASPAFAASTASNASTDEAASPPSVASSPAPSDNDGPAYGPELQGFDYPYPVGRFAISSQRQIVRMAYMDVAPKTP